MKACFELTGKYYNCKMIIFVVKYMIDVTFLTKLKWRNLNYV